MQRELLQRGVQLLGQRDDLLGQLGVDLQQRSQAGGLVLDVGALLIGQLGEAPGVVLVAVGLARLGEQDQWRRVRGLRRERQVQQDERVRVPAQAERDGVDDDPGRDEHGLPDDELRCPEEACKALGEPAEGVVAERPVQALGDVTVAGCSVAVVHVTWLLDGRAARCDPRRTRVPPTSS